MGIFELLGDENIIKPPVTGSIPQPAVLFGSVGRQ
jgi:hypothetical protein